MTPKFRLDEADGFNGYGTQSCALVTMAVTGNSELGPIGHELCNLLLLEHIEADDTAKQGRVLST